MAFFGGGTLPLDDPAVQIQSNSETVTFVIKVTVSHIVLNLNHLIETNVVIDRVSHEIVTVASVDEYTAFPGIEYTLYGIYGILELPAGPCLIGITAATLIGHVLNSPIYQLDDVVIIPFIEGLQHLNTTELRAHQVSLNRITQLMHTPHWYFSPKYDLTTSLQHQSLMLSDAALGAQSLYDRADSRFFWNQPLLARLVVVPELRRVVFPVIMGFVQIIPGLVTHNAAPTRPTVASTQTCTYILLSRRSHIRSGTRFCRRGIDTQGHVANFVETEQIVVAGSRVSSFVQVRGSIPVFWMQSPNLRLTPTFRIAFRKDHAAAARRHFLDLSLRSGNVLAINLINSTGKESALGDAFSKIVHDIYEHQNIRYVSFDFHKECANFHWENLSTLLHSVHDTIDVNKFMVGVYQDHTISLAGRQTGIVRTNCIDCLDRTNVVQAMIARYVLLQQLEVLELTSHNQTLEDSTPGFEATLKTVWADHADVCSEQYAGSGALKADFTRTGKRTLTGLVMDGYNSATRYVRNNFFDGQKQDAYDLLTGRLNMRDARVVRALADGNYGFAQPSSGWIAQMTPYALLALTAILAALALLFPISSIWSLFLLLSVAWLALVADATRHPHLFVSQPCLQEKEEEAPPPSDSPPSHSHLRHGVDLTTVKSE
eukprot:m.42454 g.42454  ORF g.42454 m.42454 type:complete len:657 (+) comp10692_c0_seq2:131-2101(+)